MLEVLQPRWTHGRVGALSEVFAGPALSDSLAFVSIRRAVSFGFVPFLQMGTVQEQHRRIRTWI